MNVESKLIEEKVLQIFRELSLGKQQQVLNFADFLIWKEQGNNFQNSEREDNNKNP